MFGDMTAFSVYVFEAHNADIIVFDPRTMCAYSKMNVYIWVTPVL